MEHADLRPALAAFIAIAQAKAAAKTPDLVILQEEGRKYIRVVRSRGEFDRSVFCFVDKSTGHILKASSWATPAKGVRGTIFAEDCGASAINEYGANYLR